MSIESLSASLCTYFIIGKGPAPSEVERQIRAWVQTWRHRSPSDDDIADFAGQLLTYDVTYSGSVTDRMKIRAGVMMQLRDILRGI